MATLLGCSGDSTGTTDGSTGGSTSTSTAGTTDAASTTVACTGKVVVAMADQVACYLVSDDELKCAGRVFKTDFGHTFTGPG